MNGHVGGRVELVAPRPVTDTGDRWRLLALVLLAVAVHAWLIANTAVTAKDSVRFARHALALWKPNQDKVPGSPDRTFPDVLRAEQDPPGYPLALAALSVAVAVTVTVPATCAPAAGAVMVATGACASGVTVLTATVSISNHTGSLA